MIIPRKIQPLIEETLRKQQKVVVVYGPRQAGKTTLVRQLLAQYPDDRTRYFNADYLSVQRTFAPERAEGLASVVAGVDLIVIDEAQRVPDIGLTLKILHDEHPQVRVLVTGSSSIDLSGEVNEPLTGRKREFYLFPFSLSELTAPGDVEGREHHITRMLRFGGYPAIALADPSMAEEHLRELTGSYLYKDIFTYQDIRKPEVLTRLVELLALQIGQEVSYHELATQLGIDQTVVQRYIMLLEAAFVVFRLPALSTNPRKEISKKRKIYFYDLGVRNAIIANHNDPDLRVDKGAVWENFCVAERRKLFHHCGEEVTQRFWRSYADREVDCIEEWQGKRRAYEYKWMPPRTAPTHEDFMSTHDISRIEVIARRSYGTYFDQIK